MPPVQSEVVRFYFRTLDRNIVTLVNVIRGFSYNAFPFRVSETPDL